MASGSMNVHVTFDIEVWCDGWADLDRRFPASFDRYFYGRSEAGNYALPKTLEILNRHGLTGVFFVEPLFAARFGEQHLDVVSNMILDAGQDVQLHIHPEWVDEISPAILDDSSRKRQSLPAYSLDEQTELIRVAKAMLERSTGRPMTAFRAGNFAVDRNTFTALRRNGILLDSSLNSGYDATGGTIDGMGEFCSHRVIDGVECFPVTVIRDGFGNRRPAQLNGCSAGEFEHALRDAAKAGLPHFVVVSHNFEMLKPASSAPDWTVVRRFERLCRFLGEHRELFTVGPFVAGGRSRVVEPGTEVRPRAPAWASAGRLVEQVARRWR